MKYVTQAPPCGTKPGRAVCEGPWGEIIPLEKRPKIKMGTEEIIGEEGLVPAGEDEEEEEEDEEEEQEEKEKAPDKEVKEKPKKRGKECYMSPESVADRKKPPQKKEGKFIPDPNYHGYDDPWNIFRTAPTEKESDVEFEKSLKLSTPQPRSTAMETKPERKKEIPDKSAVKDEAKAVSRSEEVPKGRYAKVSGEDLKRKHRSTERSVRSSSADAPTGGKSSKSISDREKESSGNKPEQPESITSKRRKHGNISDRGSSVISTPLQKSLTDKTFAQGNDGIKEGNKKKANQKRIESKKALNNEKGKLKKATASDSNKSENANKTTKPMAGKKMKLNTLINPNSKKEKKSEQRSENVKVNKNRNKRSKTLNSGKSLQPLRVENKTGRNFESGNPEKTGKRDKKKDLSSNNETDPEEERRKQVKELKSMMMSPDTYPYDVEPAVLPEEPRLPCTTEYLEKKDSPVSLAADTETEDRLIKKGPCGWRTKSEQELPTKKTLVYLVEPDRPMETIPVRPGGKPCLCRENRNKKKILLYNISGLLDKKKTEGKEMTKLFRKKKEEEDEKKTQVIDGVLYFTPPPSPRRSDEYVPEYDLYESPYDTCLRDRKDENMKLLERHAGPGALSPVKTLQSCGCNQYMDTFGVLDEADAEKRQTMMELDKERKEFMEKTSPKERWKLALKDPALLDYFTRCRDNLPCWLKCNKFNQEGCSLQYRKLQMKKPVCECKYERKILERKEERTKWKQRQKKLKSLKKQPFRNVVDTSRPVEPDTKLLISEVKRIPREDEYIDDIKYCITGVAQNYSMAPPQQVIEGVTMSTPFETPEPSKHDIKYTSVHRHWSPSNIPAGPLPRKDQALIEEKKRRQEALEEAFRQIYQPVEVLDRDHQHSCKEVCSPERSKGKREAEELGMGEKMPVSVLKKDTTDTSVEKRTIGQSRRAWESYKSADPKEKKDLANLQYKQQRELAKLKSEKHIAEDNSFKRENTSKVGEKNQVLTESKIKLMSILKKELKKMAEEGFVFAKLPRCFLMPQLQDWLMYRQGFSLSETDKKKSIRNSIELWNTIGVTRAPKIEVPSLNMTEQELRRLTFDDAEEMKEKINRNKAQFYSEVRKARVLHARSMWSTMEYGKFPSPSFKEAFFTYMASREADGLVFRPWFPSEVRDEE